MSEISIYNSSGTLLKNLYQWDTNQTIYFTGMRTDSAPVFHFWDGRRDKALVVSPTISSGRIYVDVPNILLQKPETIIIYAYYETDADLDGAYDGGKTEYVMRIPVLPKPKPEDYEYDENIDYVSVAVLDSRLNNIIIAMAEGGSGDASIEVVDMRTGYDGTSYATAGAAMRAMGSELSRRIESLRTELVDIREGYDGLEYETAGEAVRALGEQIEEVQSVLQDYVDAHAVDGLLYEDNILYLTSNDEIVGEGVEIVGGGGGGGGSSSVVRIVNLMDGTIFSVIGGAPVTLRFSFSSTEDDVPTGNGTCNITVNGVSKRNFSIAQGANSVDVSSYLSPGSNTVVVRCTDIYGVYKRLTYTITVVEVSITSTFDDTLIYTGDITFKYTPYGLIEKTVHFKVDGTEVGTAVITASGRQSTKIFPAMSHGIHTIDVYITAEMDGEDMETDHLIYDVICVEDGETEAMISSVFQRTTASQGEQLSIPYIVYDPASLTAAITLTVYTIGENNERIVYSTQELTVDRSRQYWNTRRYPAGAAVYFEIDYPNGDVSKTHTLAISEPDIDIEPVENDLEVELLSTGRSNSEENPATWTYDDVSTTFTNVNWSSSGWLEDADRDVALTLIGGAQAVIDFQPFDKDLRVNGKTIEMEFSIKDVNNRDAVVIDCMSGGIGFRATADRAVLNSQLTSIDCRYKDDEKVRIALVIESRAEYRMMSIYLNGVLSGSKQYPANDNFEQSSPTSITLGSSLCGLQFYMLRVYDTALTKNEIVNNYIADIQDITEKLEVYENNNIYDEYSNLSYEAIKPKIPVMTIVGTLPTAKGDKKTVTIIYEDPFHPELNFTDTCTIDVQGTSSQFSNTGTVLRNQYV